jgi:hypothetical protein
MIYIIYLIILFMRRWNRCVISLSPIFVFKYRCDFKNSEHVIRFKNVVTLQKLVSLDSCSLSVLLLKPYAVFFSAFKCLRFLTNCLRKTHNV